MRLNYDRVAPCLLAGLLLTACKDDPEPEGDGDGSGSSTGAASSESSTTRMDDVDTTAGDQGASGDEESSSSTGAPPTEVSVRGTIEDFFAMGPIADAEISVLGQPTLQTMSDAAGEWEMVGVPVDTFDRFVVADTGDYWGAIVPFQTGLTDLEEFELSQVSLDVIDIQIGVLQRQDPTVMVDEDASVLLVALIQNGAAGAVVEIDPPPPPGTFYAPDAGGQPTLDVNEIQWALYPVAVFFNLPPGPEGTYEITVTHPDRECTPEDAQPPTLPRHINLIRVDCPPPK